jgi:hypothetical protein
MNAETRAWIATSVAGLAAAAIGAYDGFVNHGAVFSTTGDVTFILAGLGALGLKTAYDIGVQVPTPPKP